VSILYTYGVVVYKAKPKNSVVAIGRMRILLSCRYDEKSSARRELLQQIQDRYLCLHGIPLTTRISSKSKPSQPARGLFLGNGIPKATFRHNRRQSSSKVIISHVTRHVQYDLPVSCEGVRRVDRSGFSPLPAARR
jgi:hypothetical protein